MIKGIPVSPGVGYGRGCFFKNTAPAHSSHASSQPDKQDFSVQDAFSQLVEELTSLAKCAEDVFDQNAAALFRAHRMICEEVQADVLTTINQGNLTAKGAIEKCFDEYYDYFNNLKDDYLSERANDFYELKHLLLNFLNNTEALMNCREYDGCRMGECVLKNEHILITDDLTANIAIRIKSHTKGIIADKCGVNSHAAVIARSLDIPVVSGIKNPLEQFSHHEDILIDGSTGMIIVNPDKTMLKKYGAQINRPYKSFEVIDPVPCFTVFADIDRQQDVQKAVRVKAEGIGLYRTEFEMLGKGRFLGEDEQKTIIENLIRKMAGKPVYIRLLDLGSDKSAPWLEMEDEDNPALGCRGARFLLSRPDLLQTQARAIAAASKSSPVNVIYPMITGVRQFLQLKTIFLEAVSGIDHKDISHGIMFEVPSACLNAGELYEAIDFGRIGSNDLVQYLFAHDRTSDDLNYAQLVNDPATWKMITMVVDAARKSGKPLELCGGMVEIPELIPELINLGITTISTRPENIATVRKAAWIFLNQHKLPGAQSVSYHV